MNMYLHELKSLRKTAVIWTCAFIALAALYFSIYPSMVNDAADFKELLEKYPAAVRAMLGINLDYITSILGFYSMIFSFIILCGAIQAMNMGVSILSKESREKTCDFLLVKPVSRMEIVSAKLLASITTIILTDVVFFGISLFMANSVKTSDFSIKLFLMINLTMFFIQLIFLSIGILLSVLINKLRSVLSISLGTVFGFYMIGAIISTGKANAAARFISPFKYFDAAYIIKNGSYEVPYMIFSAVIIIISIIASYFIYDKKDIAAC